MNNSRNLFFALLVTCVSFVSASEGVTPEVTPVEPATEVVVAKPSRITALFAGIVALPGASVDFAARNSGAQRLVKYLGSTEEGVEAGRVTSFFANNQTCVSRVVALAEVALITAAAYKAYQMFFVDEDNNDEDEDFAEIFEVADEDQSSSN